MASLIKLKHETGPDKGKPNGRRAIQFVGADGKRKTLRLGVCSDGDGRSILVHIKRLIASRRHTFPVPEETNLWVSRLQPDFRQRIEGVGLLDPLVSVETVERQSPTIAEFIDRYIADRKDTKPATRIVYQHTRRCLVDYFREVDAKDPDRAGRGDRRMNEVTGADAARWRIWLKTDQKLSANTINRRSGIAKQFWTFYSDDETLPPVVNPFRKVACSVRRNPDLEFEISRELFAKVEAAEPDPVKRLVYRLARFGGLRIPTEALALTWGDIDFENHRITVTAPKTEHHGKGTRMIPLFPELHDCLLAAFNEAPEGSQYVVAKYRSQSKNFRTALLKAIKRVGLEPWPKLFQNMRQTRQNELVRDFGFRESVVCGWLGNSEKVADRHYYRATEQDFALATKALQFPTQQVGAGERIEAHGQSDDTPNPENPQENAHMSASESIHWARWDSNPHVLTDKGF